MPEQLSQNQIDALIQQMSAGNAQVLDDSPKIREYDFNSPKKFTKEQLKSLDSLHETFSRMLASYFSGLLRTVCDIEVLQIEEQHYFEYNNALADTALISLVDMKPAEERYDEARIILNLSTDVGFYLIDRVLGGPGTGFKLNRDYTDIELAILSNIFGNITQRLQDAWCNNLELSSSLSGIETNSRLLQVFAPDDIVVVVMMNIKLAKNLDGSMNICIPAEFLEQVIDTFSLRFVRTNKRQDPNEAELRKQLILDTISESDMEIRVVFDEFKLELQDIVQLQPDDVIPLSKPIDSEVVVSIDQIPWFTAKLGETKLKKAIKLQNIVSNGDENYQWKMNATS